MPKESYRHHCGIKEIGDKEFSTWILELGETQRIEIESLSRITQQEMVKASFSLTLTRTIFTLLLQWTIWAIKGISAM